MFNIIIIILCVCVTMLCVRAYVFDYSLGSVASTALSLR